MKRSLLFFAIALLVGIAAGWFIFAPKTGHDHSLHATTKTGETWTCSMHPNVKLPKLGKCPICAMDLIPLSKLGAAASERTFSMSESAKKLARISTTEIVQKNPEIEVRLFGKIRHDETKMRTLSARFPGRIDRLFVDYEGVRVRKGDHLAKIYSPELLSAQTELFSAIRFGNADSVTASRDKLRLWGFSDARLAAIEKSKKPSDQLEIDSPLAGVVLKKHVNEGDYIQTGTSMFSIADLSELWVMLDAYESDLPWLRFGQTVTFMTKTFGDQEFKGRIAFIAPELDSKTRTAAVRVNVANPNGKLKPGMFVRAVVTAKAAGSGKVIDPSLTGKWISPMHPEIVRDAPGKCDVCGMDLVTAESLGYTTINSENATSPVVVPASAVLHTGKRSVVYVEIPDQKTPHYQGRDVLLGARAGDDFIVLAGLEKGERVVTEGAFKIDSALQIQGQTSMMNPAENPVPLFEKWDVTPEIRTKAGTLFSGYLGVQKALVASDFGAAQVAAKSLSESLQSKASEAVSFSGWPELQEKLAASTNELVTAKDLKSARSVFEKLTVRTDELVRRFGLEAYVMHCPMALDGKGADWLQRDKKLLNPYFGDAMLYCGDVKKHLNEPTGSDR